MSNAHANVIIDYIVLFLPFFFIDSRIGYFLFHFIHHHFYQIAAMIDLVIGLECTSSMESKLGQVRNLIISILNPILAHSPNTIRMSLVKLRSRAPHDNWMTSTFTCT